MNPEETKALLAVVEFILEQAGKHLINEQAFSKDLLQMGIAIENANAMVKNISRKLGQYLKSFETAKSQSIINQWNEL